MILSGALYAGVILGYFEPPMLQLDSRRDTDEMLPLEFDTVRVGGDYRDLVTPSPKECQAECAHDRQCVAIIYGMDMRHCWLKSAVTPPERVPGIASSVKRRSE